MSTVAQQPDTRKIEAAEAAARNCPPPLIPELRPTAEGRYRRAWAAQFLDGLDDVPRYGSREWAELPPGDARKWAAVVRAAEAWQSHCRDEDFELLQLAHDARVTAEQQQAEANARAGQVARAAATGLNQVTYRARKAQELEARAAAGLDYPGQPATTHHHSGGAE